ncbi:MAG: choice-of-anchor J domain-containing protein [Sporocytophaga sp.]|uniref:M43 family zinc metalloprotease n=1 Tax=Sporocytophaga sp. TaxID=2231183 RepID=UPI001B2205BE|nr:M43 family zinc metalloprotease [Sporocytophaga sp.]MBO9703062.1 choice-of-anchor J domain-containing protein [Sporocytophaga sp.]
MKYLLLLLSLFTSSLTYGQDRCGTMQVRQNNVTKNPALLENVSRQELQTQKFTRQNQGLRRTAAAPVIPVVVHVLYNTAAQNITDAMIQSQIDVLNHDYSATNSDISNVSAEFQPVIGNPNMQFALAIRDPNGKTTNGIIRKQTNKTSFSQTQEEAKYSSKGGDDAWPSGSYLNIWVVPEIGASAGTVLGYATFPGTAPEAEDGVVIAYKYFGLNIISAENNLGRTATHEVAHWFNLYHTFQDGCVGTNSTTCETRGDLVCDTPPSVDGSYDCATRNSCTESPDHNDMAMNYMNYADDACLVMFSAGQATRMQAALNGPRASLLTSKGLTPPIVAALNASLENISGVSGNFCTNAVYPSLTIRNGGTTNTITSINYTYKVDNGTAQSLSWTGSLATGSATTINLPTVSGLSKGNHTYAVNITQVNGKTDGNPEDDLLTKSFTVLPVQELPYSESFENSGQLPNGWSINNPDNSKTWELTSAAAINGTYSIVANNFEYENGRIDDLLSPLIAIGSNAELKFDIAYKLFTEETQDENYSDTLTVLASADCGITYDVLSKEFGTKLTTGEPYFTSDQFVPAANEWKTKTIDLRNYEGKTTRIIFRNTSDNENMLYLDNVRFEGTPLGIDDPAASADQIKLYPNPTQGSFVINAISNIDFIAIYDLLGGEIQSINPDGTNQTVDLSAKPAGVYIVKISAGGRTKVTKVILD